MVVPSEELWRRCNARAAGLRPFLTNCSINLQGAASRSAGSPNAVGLQRAVRQALWQAQTFKQHVQHDIGVLEKFSTENDPKLPQLRASLKEEEAEAMALCAAFSRIKESLLPSPSLLQTSPSPKEIDVHGQCEPTQNLAVLAQAPAKGFGEEDATATGQAKDAREEVAGKSCDAVHAEAAEERCLWETNCPEDVDAHTANSTVYSPLTDEGPQDSNESLPLTNEHNQLVLDPKQLCSCEGVVDQNLAPLAEVVEETEKTTAECELLFEGLLGKASARIALALPCKELFALRLASKTSLNDTNQQIEERLKRLWFEAARSPNSRTRQSPAASPSKVEDDSASEASLGSTSRQEDIGNMTDIGDMADTETLESKQRHDSHPMDTEYRVAESSSPKSDVISQKSVPLDVPIFLNIYDVTHYSGVQWLNALFANQYSPIKFGGIFHIGVQIGHKEWSYGYKAEGTGVFWTPPLFQAAHHFRETVRMPPTKLSKRKIATVITELEEEWTGPSYNVFGRNCCHFADALCQRLQIGNVPEWTCRLANIGSTAAEAFRLLDSPALMPLSLCSKAPTLPIALPAPEVTDMPEPTSPTGTDI